MTTADNLDPQAPGWDAFTAPDLALFEQLAHDAVVNLPQPWRDHATRVVLRIVDFPPMTRLRRWGWKTPTNSPASTKARP
jgi:predicted Zn-dependent protease with MMP-like domain